VSTERTKSTDGGPTSATTYLSSARRLPISKVKLLDKLLSDQVRSLSIPRPTSSPPLQGSRHNHFKPSNFYNPSTYQIREFPVIKQQMVTRGWLKASRSPAFPACTTLSSVLKLEFDKESVREKCPSIQIFRGPRLGCQ